MRLVNVFNYTEVIIAYSKCRQGRCVAPVSYVQGHSPAKGNMLCSLVCAAPYPCRVLTLFLVLDYLGPHLCAGT